MNGPPPLPAAPANDELLLQAEALEAEAARERVEYFERRLGDVDTGRLLDVGCGNGEAVTAWRERGIRAFGVDNSRYRLQRWIALERSGTPLVVADAGALPFADGVFHTALSSGMIEHVGVREESNPYRVEALEGRDARRERVVAELLRVTRPRGRVLVDCPNGLFPVDFWHGDRIGAFRTHGVPDTLLPTPGQFRKWGRRLGFRVRLLPLTGRLHFRQVGRHWWGRALRPLMAVYLWLLDSMVALGVERPAGWAYPYLVMQLERPPGRSLQRP